MDPHNTVDTRARMRWRARRGLLENDLLITRFLDRYEHTLSDKEIAALCELLELSDRDLLDILLSSSASVLDEKLMTAEMVGLLARIRAS